MRAVIDIGSNSIRLLLEGSRKKFIRTTKLSEGLSLTGNLSDAAMRRALAAISELCNIAKSRGAHPVYAFATEAVRAASNGPDFAARVKELTSVPVDILSGNDEARFGFLGAAKKEGASAIFDIGGASVEAACGTAQNIKKTVSLPIGIVRLSDMFTNDRARCARYIKENLTAFQGIRGDEYIGIGGTFCSAAAIIMDLKVYDPDLTHGYKISRSDATELNDTVWTMSEEARVARYKVLSAPRAKIINYGTEIICGLFEFFGISQITVSEEDNMEGYLISKSL